MEQANAKIRPYGPLMAEHRIIEKAAAALKKDAARLEAGGKIDSLFISSVIDFLRAYADKCHHGKEEDILFRDLKKKNISDEHNEILLRLLEEHSAARAAVKRLESASAENNKAAALESMKFLSWLYPKHIEVEDRHFFIPVMAYFTEEEQKRMVEEFFEFDRNIIHNKYRKIAEELGKMQLK